MSNWKIGKLKFKEGAPKPAFIPKRARKQEDKDQEEEEDVVAPDKVIQYEPKQGTGTITTSGRTIHGSQTIFREQLEAGDFIIVEHPVFKTKEERRVTLILSSKSILLEEPFLEEFSSFVPFLIKKKATVIQGENITQKYKKDLDELQKTKTIKKDEMTVRLKKGFWSYQDKKIDIKANLSRQELLNVRQKLIKDKHCW